MSIWNTILNSFATPLTATTKSFQNRNYTPTFFEYGGKTVWFNLNNEEDYRAAYNACATLKAVTNRRAQMFANGKIALINRNTENDLKGDRGRGVLKLLRRPNILQTYKQFKAQQNIYIDLFGYCPVLTVKPTGFTGKEDITALWNLPPWLFDIDFTGNWYNQASLKDIYKQFYINWGGRKKELDMDAVFLILDNGIGTDNDGNLLIPDSRVKSLEHAISLDVSAKMAGTTLLNKKGAIGILSNSSSDSVGHIPITDQEKQDVQADFRRYGITGQEFQVIITDANLKWQAMSSPIRDMMLFENMNAAMQEICDGMGVYSYLMNNKLNQGTTFNNLNEAKKSQYQDFIIPDDESRTEQLSENIIPEEWNAYLTVDYSHIEALQESREQKAKALQAEAMALGTLYDYGLLTRNQMLERLGENKVTGKEEFDKYKFELAPAINPVTGDVNNFSKNGKDKAKANETAS